MKYIIDGYRPKALFRFFEEISAIPRGSGNEGGVAEYIKKFAQERGLYCYCDEINNVFVRLPASEGRENSPTLLLQGHTDMVCEKNADTVHDFEKDPLSLYIEDGFLRARGTTLGGDDGIAVAAMLAVLDGEIKEHPPIECLFTVMEEVGLDGANNFDYSQISARRMINLDSEQEGHMVAGCAGGLRSDVSFCGKRESFEGYAVEISVKGLMGGHSGENINDSRANANKIMGRVLAALSEAYDIRLVSIKGGSKDNAIPRECSAKIACSDRYGIFSEIEKLERDIKRSLAQADANFTLTATDSEVEDYMLDEKTSADIISFTDQVQNGVLHMSDSVEGLVEFSRNLGIISTDDSSDTRNVSLVFSSRSAKEEQLDLSMSELDATSKEYGYGVRHYARYPGWDYAPYSCLRDDCLKAAREILGYDAKVDVIHAGLECGIISSHIPDMDIISIGPDIIDIHSPSEKLDLASCERFWKILEIMVRMR